MEVKITFDEFNVRDAQKINDVDIVMVKGEKGDAGMPTPEQIQTAVNQFLTAHPESVTATQYTDPLNDGNVDISII